MAAISSSVVVIAAAECWGWCHDAGVSSGELMVVVTAIFAASFLQVIAGFGFALLAMPIMTLALPVEQAVVITTLLGVITSGWQSIHQRHHADRGLVKTMTIGAYVGMPLGLVLLNVVDDQTLKIALGISVLVATAMLAGRISLAHVGPHLDYGAGFLSGVLNTSIGTNGPPLVLALQARHVEAVRFRATIVAVFALSNILAIALFIADDKITSQGVRAAVFALPAWVIGQALGWPARRHVEGERFRVLVLVMLLAVGVTTIVFAL